MDGVFRIDLPPGTYDIKVAFSGYDDSVSVLYGRCLHRGALMADGHVDGHNLIKSLGNIFKFYDRSIYHRTP